MHQVMSALGQKQTFASQKALSALPRKQCAVQLEMSALGQKRKFILSVAPFVQVTNDSCGRAPDVSTVKRYSVESDRKPLPVSAFSLVVLRRHQKSEWYFEGVINLSLIEMKCKAQLHTSEHWQNATAERRYVNVEIAFWLNKVARERDLLLGLAQRRGSHRWHRSCRREMKYDRRGRADA